MSFDIPLTMQVDKPDIGHGHAVVNTDGYALGFDIGYYISKLLLHLSLSQFDFKIVFLRMCCIFYLQIF